MGKINVIIADTDSRYLESIAKYLTNKYVDKFNVTCYTDYDILIESIANIKKKDILLINEDIYDEKVDKLGVNSIVILTEGKVNQDKYPHTLISKYSTGQDLYREIIKVYTEYNPKNIEKITNKYDGTKLITVYSPVGGSGKSTVAAALAMKICKSGQEVLYLNFEDVQSTEVYFKGNKNKSFSDLIYYVKDRTENFASKFIEISDKDEVTGVTFIKNTESILDIEEIDKDDMKWMLESLLELNMFAYIIMDTSSKFNSVYEIILNSSNHILCPVKKEIVSMEKLKIFIDNIPDLRNYFFFFNNSHNDTVVKIPDILNAVAMNIDVTINTDYNLNINEENSLLDSAEISKGIDQLINSINL